MLTNARHLVHTGFRARDQAVSQIERNPWGRGFSHERLALCGLSHRIFRPQGGDEGTLTPTRAAKQETKYRLRERAGILGDINGLRAVRGSPASTRRRLAGHRRRCHGGSVPRRRPRARRFLPAAPSPLPDRPARGPPRYVQIILSHGLPNRFAAGCGRAFMRASPALSPSTARRPSRERRIGPISCPVLPKRFRLRPSAVLVGRVPPAFSRQARSARCASATATCTGDRSARPPRHSGKSRRTSGRSGRGRHPCAPHRDPRHPSRIRPPAPLLPRIGRGDDTAWLAGRGRISCGRPERSIRP